jgi:lipopolysaccharide/colanic/teichoic acid biosynthesis glycosyltransferase
VANLLRQFSLDELPQLIHVLKKETSLVGVRPPLSSEVQKYDRWQRRRLSLKPKITCLWQINGRNKVSVEEWMRTLLISTTSFISVKLNLFLFKSGKMEKA